MEVPCGRVVGDDDDGEAKNVDERKVENDDTLPDHQIVQWNPVRRSLPAIQYKTLK